MINPFPDSRIARIIEVVETIILNPNIFARKAETKRLKRTIEEMKSEADAYCGKTGLKELLVTGDKNEITPKYMDLAIIHKLIRARRPETIVEFGVGFSTITIAHALNLNGSGLLHTVDANKHWLGNTQSKMPADLKKFVNFQFSEVRCHSINGQLCSLYDNLPNVQPEFIYLDAPFGKDVSGEINGLSFHMDGINRAPISADPLLYESTAPAQLFILVDGRARNVEFLRSNLKGRYRFHQNSVLKQSYFQKI